MNHNIELNDEISLKDLFLTLWRGKFYIFLTSFAFVFLASLHLQSVERKYTVEYSLKPVLEKKTNPNLAGLGGLSSITGIQLPASSNNDFNIFKELITSTEVSEIIFANNDIIKDIFKSEWNESINNFSSPPKSKTVVMLEKVKKLLTGNIETNYMPPNPRRLSIFISNNIEINENRETGFLKFISETSKPELMLSLMIEATKASDKIMRQRYIDFSAEPLAFYKKKLRTARSREHREALAELIGSEEQKLMFASQGNYFIAEPYINPKIGLLPSAPKPKLVLVLALLFGFFIGSAAMLIHNAMTKDN